MAMPIADLSVGSIGVTEYLEADPMFCSDVARLVRRSVLSAFCLVTTSTTTFAACQIDRPARVSEMASFFVASNVCPRPFKQKMTATAFYALLAASGSISGASGVSDEESDACVKKLYPDVTFILQEQQERFKADKEAQCSAIERKIESTKQYQTVFSRLGLL